MAWRAGDSDTKNWSKVLRKEKNLSAEPAERALAGGSGRISSYSFFCCFLSLFFPDDTLLSILQVNYTCATPPKVSFRASKNSTILKALIYSYFITLKDCNKICKSLV